MTKLTHAEQTIKEAMLCYPTLFPHKEAVFKEFFTCGGGGYEWDENGCLDTHYEDRNEAFIAKELADNAKELADDIAKCEKEFAENPDNPLYEMFLIERIAEKMKREFIFKHVDLIVRVGCGHKLMAEREAMNVASYYESPEGVTYKYSNLFNRPPKLEKSWALACIEFAEHWLYSLNVHYQVGHAKGDEAIAHWPDKAKELHNRLLQVRSECWPDAHEGKTYAEHVAFCHQMMEEFMAERKEVDKE